MELYIAVICKNIYTQLQIIITEEEKRGWGGGGGRGRGRYVGL